MHPGDQPNAILSTVGFQAQVDNCFRRREHLFPDDGDWNFFCLPKSERNFSGMFRNFRECLTAVEMLASSDKPDFEVL